MLLSAQTSKPSAFTNPPLEASTITAKPSPWRRKIQCNNRCRNLNDVKKNNKGRKEKQKINLMQFYCLKEYIKSWKEIDHRGSEFNASKQCSRCGSMSNKRSSQGSFICKDCGYQINADVNGAKNILKRAQSYRCE